MIPKTQLLNNGPILKKLFLNTSRAFASSQSLNNQLLQHKTKPYQLHRLTNGPSISVKCTKDEAIRYYKQMQMLRSIESATAVLFKENHIRGYCHLYTGQEAVCVGIKAALDQNDSVIAGYRVHGWIYIMGVSLRGILAELTGRQTGCSKGKGGSVHMFAKNFYGGHGIVGAQVPLGAGIALAHKYRNEANVCVALYGDGAANQGQVFEVFNMAKLWNLPVIFVCENNGYAMRTGVDHSSASTNFYTRGDYVPGVRVNGMDVLACKEATQFARQHALTKGPIILEMMTYRYFGHGMKDQGTTYRTQDEVQEVRELQDPIRTFTTLILNQNIATEDELKIIDENIQVELAVAMKQAIEDPELPVDDLYNHVVSNVIPGVRIRGCDNFTYKVTE